jgi:hypothetical protein
MPIDTLEHLQGTRDFSPAAAAAATLLGYFLFFCAPLS